MKSFALMLAFFTRIPVRAPETIDDALYKKGIKYLFIIGIIIGVPIGAVMLLQGVIGAYVAAFLALVIYLLLSGGLHLDGMADTVDGFAAHRDREGTLAIMKDSHIGTFGVLAICVYVVGMTVCMAQAGFAAAGLFPLVGRTAALLCARINVSATNGLGRWFVDGVKTGHLVSAILAFAAIAAVFSLYLLGWLGMAGIVVSFLAALLVTVLVVKRFAKKLGGVTGDVIGFSVEFSQLVFLLFSCIAVIIV
jgi:adenosylcobinamide-GDP ribazoletransferase